MKRQRYTNLKVIFILLATFLIALGLRLYGSAWDGGLYLHPDERFLTMVVGTLRLPQNWLEYFSPQLSPLNPYNTGNAFFVYGHFPLTLAKLLAVSFGFDNYAIFYKLARALSALFDASVVLALYATARRLFSKQKSKEQTAVLSGLVYALLVLPIQQAHFFTSDAFVNAFFVWALCFAVYSPQGVGYLLLSAAAYGLGLASKINLIYALPLILGTIFLESYYKPQKLFGFAFLFGIVNYLTLRVADPYLFESSNFFDPRPASLFLANLKELQLWTSTTAYPPSVQWLNTGFFFPLKNLFFFGTGGIFFLLGLFGYFQVLKKRQNFKLFLFYGLWILGFYSFLSLQSAKTMRYFLFLYPLIALFSAFALTNLKKLTRAFLVLFAAVWTSAFMFIYTVEHSRIQASDWMNRNIRPGSTIVWEYWDDPLPLYQLPGRNYKLLPHNFYEPDTPEKWRLLARKLRFVDYLILSSNRQSGSIGRAPELYPIGSKYYRELEAGKLGFRKIQVFASYPTLRLGKFKLEFPDQWAEEAFTVYDHPQVQIYQKTPAFRVKKFLKALELL